MHRLHDSLNRLFDGESRPGADTASSAPNRDAASNTGDDGGPAANATGENGGAFGVVGGSGSTADSSSNTPTAGESTDDSRIVTVVNPNYTPARNGGERTRLEASTMDDPAAGLTTYVVIKREKKEHARADTQTRTDADKQTHAMTNRHRHSDKWTHSGNRQTDSDKQSKTDTERTTDSQPERTIDSQTDRQTNSQYKTEKDLI